MFSCEKFKLFRKEKKLTQAQIAEAISVDQAAISYYENGERTPPTNKLPELAKILGCSIDQLFQNNERKE